MKIKMLLFWCTFFSLSVVSRCFSWSGEVAANSSTFMPSGSSSAVNAGLSIKSADYEYVYTENQLQMQKFEVAVRSSAQSVPDKIIYFTEGVEVLKNLNSGREFSLALLQGGAEKIAISYNGIAEDKNIANKQLMLFDSSGSFRPCDITGSGLIVTLSVDNGVSVYPAKEIFPKVLISVKQELSLDWGEGDVLDKQSIASSVFETDFLTQWANASEKYNAIIFEENGDVTINYVNRGKAETLTLPKTYSDIPRTAQPGEWDN